ncbi:NACHT domain-containing protein [Aspergillus melleus]|uniref:NACHT domain-containing protein n=1 Tax=Aspergillus melleus TaxID=138277 RepID=UPI001E8E3F68|nr:uncharacterized protein LDX57_004810 [Aspergillus melleus]KAH8427093.1 hypothetical protein LDX57_004810 [Aspergillus melleus]
MGKTTLCKKIIHAFVRNELWQSEFDSVIFIDLRVAKHFWSASKFFKECFRVSFWPKDWYIELMKAADDPGDTRTLVVFDGLEELSQTQWESWDTFLHRKNVIITCRPHVLSKWKRLQFDLDVQVIGFHDDEVSSYLNKMVPDAPDVLKPQFMDFIAQHPVIKDMLRIPIISDAVCSLWVDCVGRRKRVTMATLYQEIEIRLWQKDLIRLHGMTISHSSSYIYPRKLYEIFSREVGFLRSIAFFGVYNNITEFPESIRRKFQSLELQVLEHVFDIISFLRSTAYRFNASVRDYSFLHPTFQQYFAAHYFLDCWKFGKDIEALDLNYNQINSQPTECFRKERQNERYDLLWQFVMGALNCEDRDQLEKALEKSYEERWFF